MSYIGSCLTTELDLALLTNENRTEATQNKRFLKQHGLTLLTEGSSWVLLSQDPGHDPVDSVLLSLFSHKHALIVRGSGSFSAHKPLQESAVEYVDSLLSSCAVDGGSDIHIEPYQGNYRVRMRSGGRLDTKDVLSVSFAKQVVARIKVMADLDLTEQPLPQDGRLTVTQSSTRQYLEFRLNCCCVLNGEKLVLRCLKSSEHILPLADTGLMACQYQGFQHALSQSQGLIIVTGPTGSGKTSTLYSALKSINIQTLNVCTVEDPVEAPLNGCTQLMVNERKGLSFASLLRALLRQDPDVIMIGEIRDAETAQIALQAAQTGHLVLTTMHTNGTLETLARLKSLGVNPLDIASALNLIVSQRLLSFKREHNNIMRHAIFEILPWQPQAHALLKPGSSDTDKANYLQDLGLPSFDQAKTYWENQVNLND
ncbi:type II secretion protein ATPase [Idiomarina sp. X4]|uniref:GspE/PulE family protein n=1 Tax=Idiomarina sp. X4 TaxID=2055892 RepID=UPI000C2893F8|nr:GspE/PulE family protein [Idiomarina sp. X4]ATZ72802.1 type II secretion protein ATPase [Idiomarina sp. X4]